MKEPDLFLVGQVTLWDQNKPKLWEFQGVYDSKEKAEAVCVTKDDFVMPVTINEVISHETEEYGYYPLRENERT